MKIGIYAYDRSAHDVIGLAAAADDSGFDSLWVGEHMLLPVAFETEHPTEADSTRMGSHGRYPPIVEETELLDPLLTLSAAAAITSQIELATGIFVLPMRHPLAVARSVCTLQAIAAGRFVFGVGFGWLKEEFDALDVPFNRRISRFEEGVDILRAACAGGETAWTGKNFSFEHIQVTPHPVSVPLIFAGNSPPALERAAREGDGWFASGNPTLEESCRLRSELLRLRADTARAEEPFRLTFRASKTVDPSLMKQYEQEGFEEILIWSDSLWPVGETGATKQATLNAAAESLGLVPRRQLVRQD